MDNPKESKGETPFQKFERLARKLVHKEKPKEDKSTKSQAS